MAGAPAGFQARVGKIRRLPTLVFSLHTLPYVTVAHHAHRIQADLREKASLATNQEGPPPFPSPPSDLALQLGLYTRLVYDYRKTVTSVHYHACVTEIYHVYHHQVHHSHLPCHTFTL